VVTFQEDSHKNSLFLLASFSPILTAVGEDFSMLKFSFLSQNYLEPFLLAVDSYVIFRSRFRHKKEVVVAYFKALFQHSLKKIEGGRRISGQPAT
jgi:hypothetical protein